MGEWSEYFEDFPEENPANYVGGRFDPKGAADARQREARAVQVARESAALQKQMFEMAAKAKADAVARREQAVGDIAARVTKAGEA